MCLFVECLCVDVYCEIVTTNIMFTGNERRAFGACPGEPRESDKMVRIRVSGVDICEAFRCQYLNICKQTDDIMQLRGSGNLILYLPTILQIIAISSPLKLLCLSGSSYIYLNYWKMEL